MNYRPLFSRLKDKAHRGSASDVDFIMKTLDLADLPITRAVDFYLGFVESQEGQERLAHYLFHGSQIQRNYCALFFERRNEWDLINRAFKAGRIDRIQAYSR